MIKLPGILNNFTSTWPVNLCSSMRFANANVCTSKYGVRAAHCIQPDFGLDECIRHELRCWVQLMGRLGTTPATAAWLLPCIKLPDLVASSAYLSLWIIDPQVPLCVWGLPIVSLLFEPSLMLPSVARNDCLDVRRCICTCLWVSSRSIPCLLGSAKLLLHNFTLSRLSLRRIAFLAHLPTYQQFLNLQTKFYVEISSFYFHPLPSLSPQRCVGSFSLCSLSQVRLIYTGHHQLCRRRQFSHICDTEAQAIAKLLCRTELKVLEFSCAGCNLLPMLLQPVEKWGCPVLGHWPFCSKPRLIPCETPLTGFYYHRLYFTLKANLSALVFGMFGFR